MIGQNAARDWKQEVAPYERPRVGRSAWQLVNTIAPFLVLWCLAYFSLSLSYWLTMVFVMLAAGFLIRTFILFHDCCHYAFFPNKLANEITGIITGLLAAFPYYRWKNEHAIHHASSGNLDRRGIGDIWILTVDEYLAASKWRKIAYHIYRNPFFMFGVGPVYMILVAYRYNTRRAGRTERRNTRATNMGLALAIALACWLLGWKSFLLVEGPILYLASMAGIWLFYVQHHFDGAYFEPAKDWDYVSAALRGSSFYKLPGVLQWMVGNIGYHHIHHLSSRVPNYNLKGFHEQKLALCGVPSVGLLASLRALGYRLWDEQAKKFVAFPSLGR